MSPKWKVALKHHSIDFTTQSTLGKIPNNNNTITSTSSLLLRSVKAGWKTEVTGLFSSTNSYDAGSTQYFPQETGQKKRNSNSPSTGALLVRKFFPPKCKLPGDFARSARLHAASFPFFWNLGTRVAWMECARGFRGVGELAFGIGKAAKTAHIYNGKSQNWHNIKRLRIFCHSEGLECSIRRELHQHVDGSPFSGLHPLGCVLECSAYSEEMRRSLIEKAFHITFPWYLRDIFRGPAYRNWV